MAVVVRGRCGVTQASHGFDQEPTELIALRRDAEALSRRFAAGERAVAEPSARDPDDCVRVVLAPLR
jgi:hypothetical protein